MTRGTILNLLKRTLAVLTSRIVVNVLKYALAFALLAFMIWQNWDPKPKPGLKQIWENNILGSAPIHYDFFLLAAAITVVSISISFVRWYILVRAVGLPFTLFQAWRLGLVGFFFNAFLPGSVGGDIVKAAFLAREHDRRTIAVATVIMDRVIALWALIWFVAILGSVFWLLGMLESKLHSLLIVLGSIGISVVTILLWIILGFLSDRRAEIFAGRLASVRRIGHFLAEFWRAVWMYRRRQRSVAVAMLLSLVGHVGFVTLFYCSARTLCDPGLPSMPSLPEHFLIVPIGMVIEAVVPLPGAMGVSEFTYDHLYGMMGASGTNGLIGTLVKRVIYCTLGLLGYLVYLRMKPTLQLSPLSEKELVPAESRAQSMDRMNRIDGRKHWHLPLIL